MDFCCLDRGRRRDRKRREIFNNKKMTAAVQEAERLVRELETTRLEVKDLDEEAEYFMKKCEMEAEARGRLERHLAILRNILEERKSWPRGKPTSTARKYLYRAHRPPPYPPPLLAALRRQQHLQRREWLVLPVRAWARPFSPPPLPPSSPPPSLMQCVFHVSHRKRPRLGGSAVCQIPTFPGSGALPSLKHRCLRLARVKPSSPIRPMEVRASPPTPLVPRL